MKLSLLAAATVSLLVSVASAGPPAPSETAPPKQLDRAAISEGISKIKPKVMKCNDLAKESAKVKVRVQVSPDGSVASAKADAENELGTCIAAAMATAKFRSTAEGGSFSYPFVFGPTASR